MSSCTTPSFLFAAFVVIGVALALEVRDDRVVLPVVERSVARVVLVQAANRSQLSWLWSDCAA